MSNKEPFDFDQWSAKIDRIRVYEELLNGTLNKFVDRMAYATARQQDGFSIRETATEEKEKQTLTDLLKYFFDHFFDTGDPDHVSGYELFYIFATSAVLGSVVETLWCRLSNGFWERRTSVIYGDFSFAEAIGGVFMTLLLRQDMKAPIKDIFWKTFFCCTVMEYIMSWGEELVTGYRSWDYSNRFLNLNGRVCFMYSCFWGILGVLWTKLIYPVLKYCFYKLPKEVGKPLFWSLTAFLTWDIIVSILAKNRFTARQDGVEAHTAFQRFLDRRFPDERIIKAYPNSIKVNEDGSIDDDTLNGTTGKAMKNSPVKSKLKKMDRQKAEMKETFKEQGFSAGMEEVMEKASVATEQLKDKAATAAQEKTGEFKDKAAEALQEKTEELKDRAVSAMSDDLREKASEAKEEATKVMDKEASRLERARSFHRLIRVIGTMFTPGFERH